MNPDLPSRLVSTPDVSPMVYLEALSLFMAGNFIFHQKVFRNQGSRPQFFAYMVVNCFTSYQFAHGFNRSSLHRSAAIFENTKEMEHRATINENLRKRMFNTRVL